MTVIDFFPTQDGPFSFQAFLDGATYSCQVTWSLAGQRWYLNVYTLNGDLVLVIAMTGSTEDNNINLVKGYFPTGEIFYRPAINVIIVGP